mgnify:CR=1 FL=1|tara:strand:- start:1898 stop:2614 length:717 start_codon:yes stop_codon:yes gene_type:complete
MQYFRNFPLIDYDLDGNKDTRSIVDVFRFAKIVSSKTIDDISLYNYYQVQDSERPDHVSQKLYGTPNLYWTFFLVNENLKNLHKDWPMSQVQIEDHINKNYTGHALNFAVATTVHDKLTIGETVTGLLSGATGKVVSKDPNLGWIRISDKTGLFRAETIQGGTSNEIVNITGETPFRNATHHFTTSDDGRVPRGTAGAVTVTNDEHERELNDARERIKVIKPSRISEITDEFRKVING